MAASLCQACRLNDLVPDLAIPENRDSWQAMEIAKRHLIYTLNGFGLPDSVLKQVYRDNAAQLLAARDAHS